MKKYLILENGMTFEGQAFGADGDVIAEIVFTTSMTGYVETLTDRSYNGQAVVQTFPLIGNYGVMESDREGEGVAVSGYIVRDYCRTPSNFRSEGDIDAFLKKNNTVGIYGIDTRALTRVLREHGTMNGMICSNKASANLDVIKAYKITDSVSKVSTKTAYVEGKGNKYRVALLDFGVKKNILRNLIASNCEVTVLPYNASAEEILKGGYNGLFLTNGPGDPTDNPEVIQTIRKLTASGLPTMGICLGNQLLALANGFKTTKLKYGHRGANHPVRDCFTGKIYISSQNHGYAVVSESIDNSVASEYFVNVNDGTNEGVLYKNINAFSVQFHPEACGGPHDTDNLFKEFIKLMEKNNA